MSVASDYVFDAVIRIQSTGIWERPDSTIVDVVWLNSNYGIGLVESSPIGGNPQYCQDLNLVETYLFPQAVHTIK